MTVMIDSMSHTDPQRLMAYGRLELIMKTIGGNELPKIN
jgi:hypothetical protein